MVNEMLNFIKENSLGGSQRKVILEKFDVKTTDQDSCVSVDSLELIHDGSKIKLSFPFYSGRNEYFIW